MTPDDRTKAQRSSDEIFDRVADAQRYCMDVMMIKGYTPEQRVIARQILDLLREQQ